MDIGKKCLVMGVIGAILTIFSSVFVIYMIFKGGPIDMLVERKTLEPFPPSIFGPVYRVIDNRTILPYNVMELILSPGEGKERYRVVLNVETNSTIHISVSGKDNNFNLLLTFSAGNHTADIPVSKRGTYLLNVTGVESDSVGVKFKIIESWYYGKVEMVPQLDSLKTIGSIIGFITGISLLAGALIRLRKAIREARPEIVERTATRQRYLEVEEE